MDLKEETIKRNSKDAKDRFVKGCSLTETKAIDRDNRTIDGVASTINLDRDEEVILPKAFEKTLPQFLERNAPFLAAHVHRAYEGQPTQIGWVLDARISEMDVRCRFRFAETDVAEQWWRLASDLNGRGIAFSIGFIPRRRIYGSVADLVQAFPELKPIFARAGLAEDRRVVVYTEIELLEISAVPVPSNREAMQLGAKLAKAFGLEGDEIEGEKALDLLAEKIAERVQVGTVEIDIEGLVRGLQSQLAEYQEQVLSLLPDDIHAGGEASTDGPGGDRDPGGDGGGGDDGAESESVRQARAGLLEATKR